MFESILNSVVVVVVVCEGLLRADTGLSGINTMFYEELLGSTS